ncbi:MAG: undecaprenyl/decaprenyl-phosphate alpha-N-acetylglucosaminyl 1-phosphate transferase, partial [Candidatus Latescibacteria bacterium]|nr:undecaprenyl/decaprenyl-phosphate alpha-N-acetylglucosaminyl 1-phosphate transferase [Candidatus Latescibacterota bacterium]
MEFVIPCLAALVAVLALTPLARYVAHRRHFLDHPEDRKVHKAPVPLLGGIAVFGGVLIALATGISLGSIAVTEKLIGLVLGAGLLVVLGLVDDRQGMSPAVKLAGQILAGAIIVYFGFRVSFIENEFVSVLVSLFWIVGLINAMNLLDNMDGMTGGVAFIASSAFLVVSILSGDLLAATLAGALGGACLGYLRYNLPPASIFLGDAGSMLVGFLLAALGLMISNGQQTFTGLAIPLIVLAYPIFDTTLVTITRLAEGRSVAIGGKDHSTHRIFTLTNSARKTVLWVYGINSLLTVAAIYLHNSGDGIVAG